MGHRLSFVVAIAVCFSLAGCGLYLHNADLKERTEKLPAQNRDIDVANKVKAVVDASRALEQAEIAQIIAEEAATRNAFNASLLLTGTNASVPSDTQSWTERLAKAIKQRADYIGTGHLSVATIDQWQGLFGARTELRAEIQRQSQSMMLDIQKFNRTYTTKLLSCEEVLKLDLTRLSDPQKTDATVLRNNCQGMALREQTLAVLSPAVQQLQAAKGALREVSEARNSLKSQLGEQQTAYKQAKNKLEELTKLAELANQTPGEITKFQQTIRELDKYLTQLDSALDRMPGDHKAPGALLAAIEFRQTNLRDVIAAIAKPPKAGTKEDGLAASQKGRAAIGFLSGIVKLQDALRDDPKQPTPPELAIALAAQENLARSTKARMEHLERLIAIREEQIESMTFAFEMLVLANTSLKKATAAGCKANTFGEFMRTPACSRAKYPAAQALVAFSAAWAGGDTPIRAAEMRAVHERRALGGQLAVENAAARQKVIQIALDEIAAYGAGGIKLETIAQLLQVVGIGVIAKGVN